MSLAKVIVPIPKFDVYDYIIPGKLLENCNVGSLVVVPFGKRQVVGLVSAIIDTEQPSQYQLKEIIDFFQNITITAALFKLQQWMSDFYLAPPGEVLRTIFPGDFFKQGKSQGKRAKAPLGIQMPGKQIFQLNSEQQEIVDVYLKQENYFAGLLHGITGSGKTEVYMHIARAILSHQKSVLILVPEIALTPQLISRFAERFGEAVVAYHSSLTESQRLKVWWQIYQGASKVVIGTRSSLFLPFQNLGFIVVDEEHDHSYKQEERVRYHGRDVAVMRAYLEKIPVLMGSATPSLESWQNVKQKKYQYFQLKERATLAEPAELQLVHLSKVSWDKDSLLSAPLLDALQATLQRQEQAILFINRRGFAPSYLCQQCGHIWACPHCAVSLIYHDHPKQLRCHYCEYQCAIPEKCEICHNELLQPLGTGTQRVEQRLQELFPFARVGRLDRDVSQKRDQLGKVLMDFAEHKLDILVGTQLVVKGHDFPKLSLVGVLMADQGMQTGDFRAAERCFQMLTQVAGRAGRHEFPGKVLIQCFKDDYPAIQAALQNKLLEFYDQELMQREILHYPPHTRMVLLRVSGIDQHQVIKLSEKLIADMQKYFEKFQDCWILGPAPAMLEKLRGRYRWQIMIKVGQWNKLRSVLLAWYKKKLENVPAGLQLSIDVDPVGGM